MKEIIRNQEQTNNDVAVNRNGNICGVSLKSNLRAGYNCPQGWWKYNENKARMCCHWVYDPRSRNYEVECTT